MNDDAKRPTAAPCAPCEDCGWVECAGNCIGLPGRGDSSCVAEPAGDVPRRTRAEVESALVDIRMSMCPPSATAVDRAEVERATREGFQAPASARYIALMQELSPERFAAALTQIRREIAKEIFWAICRGAAPSKSNAFAN